MIERATIQAGGLNVNILHRGMFCQHGKCLPIVEVNVRSFELRAGEIIAPVNSSKPGMFCGTVPFFSLSIET